MAQSTLKLGMPTLIEAPSLRVCAQLCKELGLDFIEINMNMPQYQPQTIDPAALCAVARRYGVGYTMHIDENLNACDFNKDVAQAYTRSVLQTILLARTAGIPTLNMHLSRGVHFTLPDRKVYLFDAYREIYMDGIRRFRDACTEAIGGDDVRICLENYNGYLGFQREAIDLLLQSPAFGLTLDVGHNHVQRRQDEAFILERGERLCHMHLHDAMGQRDHLSLGEGEMDIPAQLALAKAHGCSVVVEVKTIASLRDSIAWLRAREKLL
ncbi:MAG: sugar phosphate isomerase/epimerase [Clostridia bacterium]|nr:sugar phosphate isomerase/epimerase [Clostridia bacterium]